MVTNPPSFLSLGELYKKLMEHYGPQGWWPLLSWRGTNPTLRGRATGYHEKRYDIPSNNSERLEIAFGAILTQNTTWVNAEKALLELSNHQLIDLKNILKISTEELAPIIRSSGYYNQKAIKLQNLARFFIDNPIMQLLNKPLEECRSLLLTVKGVGPETADSILLYSFGKPIFVIDAYTRRLLVRMGYLNPDNPNEILYEYIQSYFQSKLEQSVPLYNEYHALIVQHSVHICGSKPKCDECFLKSHCIQQNFPIKKKSSKKAKK